MPKNREAIIRYRVINRCLVNRQYATIKELVSACEEALDKRPLGERTIRRDLHDMKYDRSLGFYAPITYDYQNRAYTYKDRDYSIDNLPLSDEEMNALIFASSLLEQFQGVEPLDHIHGAIQKIAHHLKIRRDLKESDHNNIIDLEKAPKTPGTEYITPILKAIQNRHVLRLTYRAFDKDRSYHHTFHPYLLKEYRNRWYVFGYNSYWKGLRLYALDRIEGLETDPSGSYKESEKPPGHYFRNLIGVTRFKGNDPEEIILRFSQARAPYIITQPLHESQRIIEQTDDHLVVSLKVHISPELEILLLGMHKEVEVLKPAQFRNKIRNFHKDAFLSYTTPGKEG